MPDLMLRLCEGGGKKKVQVEDLSKNCVVCETETPDFWFRVVCERLNGGVRIGAKKKRRDC